MLRMILKVASIYTWIKININIFFIYFFYQISSFIYNLNFLAIKITMMRLSFCKIFSMRSTTQEENIKYQIEKQNKKDQT